jgi:hypothetical protein
VAKAHKKGAAVLKAEPTQDPKMQDHTWIKNFARDRLGCNCPDAVFEHIEYMPATTIRDFTVLVRRIVIGNRLLIYIWEPNDTGDVETYLPLLLNAGKEERDDRGLNRFRLVIGTTDTEGIKSIIDASGPASSEKDPKAHLHVIHKKDIPRG